MNTEVRAGGRGSMAVSVRQLAKLIHDSSTRVVLAITGGGSRALADLLEVPGASRTLVEAAVPYCERSLVRWLGCRPEQFCSSRTARAMAMTAFRRALEFEDAEACPAGVACTAGLATDRPKLGEHRAYVAVQTVARTLVWSLELTKGKRSRAQEERLVGRLLLNAVAAACGVDRRMDLDLGEHEHVDESQVDAPPAWQDLLLGRSECVFRGAANPVTGAILPGAFNPVHDGHRRMLQIGRELLGLPVALEMSVINVDKPPLDYCEIQRRLVQFPADQPLWLSRAATFEEKSRLFPCATFLVGSDTLRRIADPRYYGDDPIACQAALFRMAARGCKFLVFGRDIGTGFVRLSDLDLPDALEQICREVPAERFREDVSSTAIRKRGTW